MGFSDEMADLGSNTREFGDAKDRRSAPNYTTEPFNKKAEGDAKKAVAKKPTPPKPLDFNPNTNHDLGWK